MQKFGNAKKMHYLCTEIKQLDHGVMGNTTGFGSVIMGSSPVGPTTYIQLFEGLKNKLIYNYENKL